MLSTRNKSPSFSWINSGRFRCCRLGVNSDLWVLGFDSHVRGLPPIDGRFVVICMDVIEEELVFIESFSGIRVTTLPLTVVISEPQTKALAPVSEIHDYLLDVNTAFDSVVRHLSSCFCSSGFVLALSCSRGNFHSGWGVINERIFSSPVQTPVVNGIVIINTAHIRVWCRFPSPLTDWLGSFYIS